MTLLTAVDLFGRAGAPLRVHEVTAYEPSGAVTAESVKIVFMLDGWAEVRSRTETASLSVGTVLIIPSSLECWGFPTAHARTATFYIHEGFLAEHLRWLPRVHPLMHLLQNAIDGDRRFGRLHLPVHAMRDLTPRLVHLAQLSHHSGDELAVLSITAAVLDAVGRCAGTPMSSAWSPATLATPRDEVTAAARLLHSDPSRAWRIDDLAHAVALSTSQLGRLFRAQIGVSPAAYLARLRTDRMAELLATASLGVGEAALLAGWQNATVASRAFKRRYGVSPRSFAAHCPVSDDDAPARRRA